MTAVSLPPDGTGPSVFDGAAVTHNGAVRTLNEDSYLVTPWICLVADGMGGHQGGEVASNAIVERFEAAAGAGPLSLTELEPLIADINASIHEKAQRSGADGMGSTLVGVALVDNGGAPSAVVFNVGDSRCYRLDDDGFTLITIDHSHVQELVAAGKITAGDAATHPLRNVVTRAIGPEPSVVADFIVLPDQPCRLLLCSDGVSGELDDGTIERIVAAGATPQATALALIEEVLRGPARDNATALVVDIDSGSVDDVTIPRDRIEELSAEITTPRGSAPPT
jgi:protein phosphatase